MAQISESGFKTAVATAATALTTALKDSALTQMAASLSHPSHPLRRIEKLFNLNRATGVVTSDDVYITAAYDGETLSKPNKVMGIATELDIVLVSAVVADADPDEMVLTFNQSVQFANITDIAPTKTISSTVISGKVVTVTVSVAFDFGDDITVSGLFKHGLASDITLDEEEVTNNVAE